MSSFDPMAAAIDWLDAYREANLAIVDLYSPDAVLECRCDGHHLVRSRDALVAYWRQRFVQKPAGALERLRISDETIVLSYAAPGGIVQAKLMFNDAGLIVRSQCCPI